MILRPYQLEDVISLRPHPTHGIFNEQRTGKTPTSLVAISEKVAGRIVIVSTASMLYVWEEESIRWTRRPTFVFAGKNREDAFFDWGTTPNAVLILSYDMFKTVSSRAGMVDKILKAKPEGLIVDEAHRAVGRKTANFKALARMRNVPCRLYLTGTPAPSHPSQVWSLLHFIDPKTYSSYWQFVESFFNMDEQRLPYHVQLTSGVNSIQEPTTFKSPALRDVYTSILAQHSIMRKRKDVMPWLPPATQPRRIRLHPTASLCTHIDKLNKFFKIGDLRVQGILDQLLRTRQLLVDPKLVGVNITSVKTDWLCTFYKEYDTASIIIFSRFTQYLRNVQEALTKKGATVGLIVGGVSPSVRKSLLDDFQSDRLKILLIQIDAGKEGLTLDNADYLIFTDIYPPASDILQARDRIVATSEARVKPTEIIELVMADTYDECLYDMVESGISETDIANNYIHYLKGGIT